MKTQNRNFLRRAPAFTLIELLVVIAIIGILAALLFPAGTMVKNNATRKRAKVELQFVENAINSYKAQLGHYPPDNPADTTTWVSQLYYELLGTTFTTNNAYLTPSGEGSITNTGFAAFFGVPLKVGGFVNATKGGGDDSPVAKNFLTGLKLTQYLLVADPRKTGNANIKGIVLGTAIDGPVMLKDATGNITINPWRYVVAGATNNPGNYDLWVDILIGGKTNRISNWRDSYEIVP